MDATTTILSASSHSPEGLEFEAALRSKIIGQKEAWVSISRKGVSRDGSGELREIQIPRSDG
jgi:hypothetical protein